MNHFKGWTELGIFVLQRVETMGAGREDFLEPHSLKLIDILTRAHPKEVFTSHPSEIDAAAPLRASEYTEIQTGSV